jgi:predicted Zn-dependent peptidase
MLKTHRMQMNIDFHDRISSRVLPPGLAALMVRLEYFDLGTDYPLKYASLINTVTGKAVLEAAEKYLHPENAALSVVANIKELEGIEDGSFLWKEPAGIYSYEAKTEEEAKR